VIETQSFAHARMGRGVYQPTFALRPSVYYRNGRSPRWLRSQKPRRRSVRREASGDWGKKGWLVPVFSRLAFCTASNVAPVMCGAIMKHVAGRPGGLRSCIAAYRASLANRWPGGCHSACDAGKPG